MKRRIRKRRVLKWIGVGVCAFLCAAWIVSVFFLRVTYSSGSWGIDLRTGEIVPWKSAAIPSRGATPSRGKWALDWNPHGSIAWKPAILHTCFACGPWASKSPTTEYHIPILPLFVAISVATLWLWSSDRLSKSGCKGCEYDLTGNVSGVCPECGVLIEVRRRPYLAALGIGLISTLLTSLIVDKRYSCGPSSSSVTFYIGQPWTYASLEQRGSRPQRISSWDYSILAFSADLAFWSALALLILCLNRVSQERIWSRSGQCRSCGYDLSGNESGICPECGTTIESV